MCARWTCSGLLSDLTRLVSRAAPGPELVALALATVGILCSAVACGLPMWTTTAWIGGIVAPQTTWEGLWMACVARRVGHPMCRVYQGYDLLQPPRDLQAARTLTILATAVGVLGLLLGIAGARCTTFVEDEVAKGKVALAAGAVLVVAGVLVLAPVCWASTSVWTLYPQEIIRSKELGVALYIGWGAAGLLLLAGALLCSSCPPLGGDRPYHVQYIQGSPLQDSGVHV